MNDLIDKILALMDLPTAEAALKEPTIYNQLLNEYVNTHRRTES